MPLVPLVLPGQITADARPTSDSSTSRQSNHAGVLNLGELLTAVDITMHLLHFVAVMFCVTRTLYRLSAVSAVTSCRRCPLS
jgi:hypothetical protein